MGHGEKIPQGNIFQTMAVWIKPLLDTGLKLTSSCCFIQDMDMRRPWQIIIIIIISPLYGTHNFQDLLYPLALLGPIFHACSEKHCTDLFTFLRREYFSLLSHFTNWETEAQWNKVELREASAVSAPLPGTVWICMGLMACSFLKVWFIGIEMILPDVLVCLLAERQLP